MPTSLSPLLQPQIHHRLPPPNCALASGLKYSVAANSHLDYINFHLTGSVRDETPNAMMAASSQRIRPCGDDPPDDERLQEAFCLARESFLRKLPSSTKKEIEADLSHFPTAKEVTKQIEEIERKQAERKSFRGLGRIKNFIQVLEQFSGVVDTFSQVQPDILCLIWACYHLIHVFQSGFQLIQGITGSTQIPSDYRQYLARLIWEDHRHY
jgi:hypothetical protein